MLVEYELHLFPCTHEDDIRLNAKHFAIKSDHIRCSHTIFQVVQSYRHWQNVNLTFHKATRRGQGRSDQEIAQAKPNRPIHRSATAFSRMFPSHCGCAVALRHDENQHLVCLKVAGALTTTASSHCMQVAILCMCCILAARVEITSYAGLQKKFGVVLYDGARLIFV
jgi:hypothetical protein